MATYVAFFRAVNVPGHARISTAELERTFVAAGAGDVASFGHAGTLVLRAERDVQSIMTRARDAIERHHGERPLIVTRSAQAILELVSTAPFESYAAAPSDKLYVVFLARTPRRSPKLPLASPTERLTVLERRGRDVLLVSGRKRSGFYGFPNGFVETAFGVPATTRNWTTVSKLAKRLAC
jgi:uncharacterized protein (DUF1697 family)